MNSYSIIGLMSGTSLDGLDIANCSFTQSDKGSWKFAVNQTQTVSYPNHLFEQIQNSTEISTTELLQLNKTLGAFFADSVLEFLDVNNLNKKDIDAIASHGHTVFHQPDKGFTLQIGCGETISLRTGLPVINDFRQKDVIAGGQGAPLVPIGDKLLFSTEADAFLNIGGFSNVCFLNEPIIAYDICPGNLPLNKIAQKLGKPYDDNGQFASEGTQDLNLLAKLNALTYYTLSNPKSLGTEWLDAHFYPLLDEQISPKDTLRTLTEHVAAQISSELNRQQAKSVMITGGGAKNSFLIERVSASYTGKIKVPSEKIIDFKEAIIFAFLGALYLAKQPNCLASVTGAKKMS